MNIQIGKKCRKVVKDAQRPEISAPELYENGSEVDESSLSSAIATRTTMLFRLEFFWIFIYYLLPRLQRQALCDRALIC